MTSGSSSAARISGRLASILSSAIVGTVGFLCALALWYGWPLLHRRHPTPEPDRQDPSDIASKIEHALTEARMVLPGAQALLDGVSTLEVSKIVGTSLTMIEKHYGHLVHDTARERLAKVQMV